MRTLNSVIVSILFVSSIANAAELYLNDLIPIGDEKILTYDNGFPIQTKTYRGAGYKNNGTYEARTFDRRFPVLYTARHMDTERESLSVASAYVQIDDIEKRQTYLDEKLDIAQKAGHTFLKTAQNVWESIDFRITEKDDGVLIEFKGAETSERESAIIRHALTPAIGPLKINETKAERVYERLQVRDCDFKRIASEHTNEEFIQTVGRCLGYTGERKSTLRLIDGRLREATIELDASSYRAIQKKLSEVYDREESIKKSADIVEGIRYFTYEPPQSMRDTTKRTALEVRLTRNDVACQLTYSHPIGSFISREWLQKDLETRANNYMAKRKLKQ